MRVELHLARTMEPEAFDRRDTPIRIVYPDTPLRVHAFTVPFATENTEVLIGRYPGQLPAGTQWSWTGPVPDAEEDTDLSREQLRLRRRNGRWELSVPGRSPDDKPGATIQYWGSGISHFLTCTGSPMVLVPGSNLSAAVQTDRGFYWALFAVPPENGQRTVPRRKVTGGRPTSPTNSPSTADPYQFPAGWEEAVAIKFRPFLSWPMGWQPALVQPSRYPPPPTDYRPHDSPGQRADKWADSVKRRLGDLKAAAIRRGMSAVAPRVIDVALLEWLVANGELRLERHRCAWLPAGKLASES